mmetsp:Transcript_29620/g.49787  ORF Transcript_29620/g.49787 Transcript_29620/m.49787 type:complete len:274 (+) Transcript_29620:244-1065(+)|eukprot:CAMPEP_0198213818 /NCGR_PEP_ID=MMETSP1445-20131203/33776_1 /TAXON_ID=36898 /ORGANISM="Pyramimonas sp., Strain CCMP2087" /LENGTH=273 /DNA_ID=CAMNT_0043888623 /DNA_START=176 /DNA_END=997 /DNA_ORIENTATION=+
MADTFVCVSLFSSRYCAASDDVNHIKIKLLPMLVAVLVLVVTYLIKLLVSRKTKRDAAKESAGGKRIEVGAPTPEQVLGLIKKRRSIFPKDYDGSAPPREHIEQMLEAANWAPTHGKTEPWRFVVMSGEGKAEFEEMCHETMKEQLGEGSDKYEKYLEKRDKKKADKAKVSHLIAICMKRKTKPDKIMPEWEEMAACACAVQNMHLMATALGVASYWSTGGPLDSPNLLQFCDLTDEGDRCLGLFHVGMAPPERVQAYRATRGPIGKKVTWRG